MKHISAAGMRLPRPALAWFGALCGWFLLLAAGAAEVMPPAPPRYFNDFAAVTKPGAAEALNKQLEQFEKETSSQIVVAVFPKMESDSSMDDYVNRMYRAWKIGQKSQNNGILLAVFVADRKVRIEVGYGLEGTIPDATAKRIIENEITPHFRNGDYAGGLGAGVTALMQAARGEYKGTGRTANQSSPRRLPWPLFIFFGLFIVMAISSLGRRARGTAYSRRGSSHWGAWPVIIPGGWGGGGGWSGGGGSGGGFSGGGGDSGGGGASGSW